MKLTMSSQRRATLRIVVTGRLILGPELGWPGWRPVITGSAGRVLELDMSRVSQVDAAGLGLLVMLAVELRIQGGRLRLMCVQPRVRTLVRTVGLGAALGLVSEGAVARVARRRGLIGGGWIPVSTGIGGMPGLRSRPA